MPATVRVSRSAAAASVLVVCAAAALHAEPLPVPSVDYATKAKMMGGATMHSRHSGGKLRVEMQVPGVPQAMTTYVDLHAKKGVTVMSLPGMPATAIEADFGDGTEYGAAVGGGKRVGTATVAGEACDLWEVESDSKQVQDTNAVACITRDAILLRMEATFKGKREVVIEVTELSRTKQDPKLLTPPPNLKPMRMPKGIPGIK